MIYIFLLIWVVCIAYYVFNNVLRKQMLQNFSDRYILVTGCDTGFGNNLAKCLDRIGVPVFAGCLTKFGASKLHEESSSRLKAFKLDVTKADHIEAAVKFVEDNLPADKEAPLEIWTKRYIDDTLAVNLFGPVYVTKAFLPLLRKSKGRIVYVSSVNALTAFTVKEAPFSLPKDPSKDISQVTDNIIHALLSVRPKYTYLSGRDTYTTWYPLSIAPRWLSDWYFAMPAPDAVKLTR